MKKGSFKQRNDLIYILFSVVLGLLMGWITVDLMEYRYIGAILCNLGIWVFLSSILAGYSQSAVRGGMHVAIFLVSVIVAYYGHLAIFGNSLVFYHIVAQLLLILVGALLGFVVWHSSAKEWLGAICISVPISLLLAESYWIYKGITVPLLFDVCAALILLILFAPGKYKKLMVLPFVLIFTFALAYFHVFSNIFGGWI